MNPTTTIKLTRQMNATIDAEDLERVSLHRWRAFENGGIWYAATTMRCPHCNRKWLVPLHRLVMRAKGGELIDHRNGDGLDNRKENLRICTHAENMRNRRRRKRCASQFKGVFRDGPNRWRAAIHFNKQVFRLGSFRTELDAAKAYDAKAKQLFGEFAAPNFQPSETSGS